MLLTSVNIRNSEGTNIFYLTPKVSLEDLRSKIKFTSTSSKAQLFYSQLSEQFHAFRHSCFKTLHHFPGNHPWWSVFVRSKLKNYIATGLKSLSKTNKLKAKHEIDNIMFRFQLQHDEESNLPLNHQTQNQSASEFSTNTSNPCS